MRNLLEKLKKFSFLSLPLCFCSFVFLDYSFRFFYRFVGDTALLSWKPMLFTLGWALLLTSLIALLPRLGRRIAMLGMILLFALLTIVHGAMYKIFGHFFTFSDTNFAGDGAKFFSWSYLDLRKAFLLCVVVSILMMAFAAFLAQKPKKGSKCWKSRLVALGLAAVSVVPVACIHSAMLPEEEAVWWGSAYNPNADPEVYREFTDSNRCVMMTGLYQYTFRNFMVSFGIGEDHQSVEKLDAFFEARADRVSGDNEMTGMLKGKNLIMVMMESIDTWLLTPEYMPNLYRCQQESVNFVNFYTPLYLSAGTFNTEIVSQTGLIPAVSGLSSSAYSTNSFPLSLANQFEQAGYTANSFHSASPSIYSRGTVHKNLGFEAYHNYVDMGMDDYQLDSQMIGGYDQMVADGKFFTYIITYSGHGPYTEEMGNIAAPHYEKAKAAVEKSGVTGTAKNMEEYTRAVAHAMETDEFVGELIDRLESEGRLENTVLLFYADHYGKYMTDREFLLQIKGVESSPAELYHTPCFLYGGGLKPQAVEKYASSVDLVPTLTNLFQLSADRRYYVGDDIFGDQGGIVVFPNYAWYDGETYYSSEYEGKVTEEMAACTADVKERTTAASDVLKCDYFKSRSVN